MARELDPVIKGQITEVLNGVLWPEVFGSDTLPEIKRFEVCTSLISRAIEAVKKIPEFNKSVLEHYFTESFDKKIPFYLGTTKFVVSYYKREGTNGNASKEEDFVLIKNDEEKINLHKYIFPSGKVNGHISYSESSPDFRTAKYFGNEKAIAECERLVKELELGSK